MSQMPRSVKSVCALLLVIGAGSLLPALWFVAEAGTLGTGAMGELIVGLLLLKVLPFGMLAVGSVVIAAQFGHGGDRVRIGAVVVGSVVAGLCAIGALVHDGSWSFGIGAGFLVIVLLTSQDARDWFGRWPR
ncbi:hypothetical protein BM536_001175 [Streptomyces phaeoluteigriseus]|uniref:Uncharacterized protein n=1 Tax=Streptomyces phaeoluteigriseus TaxID=114686 RepID=A0A1V6MZ54_9ACTN|nr:hypothetical protein [Streptomyces phaeoluteigriseus]OQD57729.1 hypothetical protein BM536_001175 [Streptomyces phaeoluteigriseus]